MRKAKRTYLFLPINYLLVEFEKQVAEERKKVIDLQPEILREMEWTPVKNPTEVNVYDFIDKTNGKASPYGVYDIQNNSGWVNVGISSDTAAFAVSTISDWWENEGKRLYPNSKCLCINADGGGSNGARNNL